MGVDTKSICMFGKRFDSFKHCLDYLTEYSFISRIQAEQAEECGELENFPLIYQDESCYSEQGGVLGLHISSLNTEQLTKVMKIVNDICPDSKLEHFTYWY